MAHNLVVRSQLDQALDVLQEAMYHNDKHGLKSLRGALLLKKGQILVLMWRLEEALDVLQEAERCYSTHASQIPGFVHVQEQLGFAYDALSNFDAARRCYQASIDGYTRIGGPAYAGVSIGALGCLERKVGNLDTASSLLRRCVDLLKDTQPIAAAVFQGHWACVYAEQGHFTRANQLLDNADKVLQAASPPHYGRALCRRAFVQWRQGRPDDARATLQAARQLAETLNLPAHTPLRRELEETANILAASQGDEETG